MGSRPTPLQRTDGTLRVPFAASGRQLDQRPVKVPEPAASHRLRSRPHRWSPRKSALAVAVASANEVGLGAGVGDAIRAMLAREPELEVAVPLRHLWMKP